MRHLKGFRSPILVAVAAAAVLSAALLFTYKSDAAARMLFEKSQSLATQNRPDSAKRVGRAAAVFARSPETHFRLGRLLKNLGDYEPALKEFKRAANASPPFAHSYREIGRFYFLGRDLVGLEEAVSAFSKEIELTQDPYSYHLRGILYLSKLGRVKDAEEDFRKETELWSSWGAPLNLAWALFEQGKWREAEDAMRLAEKLAPDSVFVDNGFGVIYLNQDRFRDAISRFSAAFEKSGSLTAEEYRDAYPGNSPEYAAEGIISIRAGIAFNLGVAQEKTGNFTEAVRWYKKTLEFLPDLKRIGVAPEITEQSLVEKIETLESK